MDTFDKLRGEELTRKEKKFDSAIQRIEEKHIEFFKSRKSIRSDKDVHDRLHNHFLISDIAGPMGIGFTDDSDLSEYIREEVLVAFREAFK